MSSPITVEEFEGLYRATAAELFAYVRRRTTADAEDLVAEIYAIAWRRQTQLPEPSLRRAWLYGVARNLLLADTRRRHRDGTAIRELAAAAEASETCEPDAGNGVVAAALNRLSSQEWEIILLTEWERLTPAEAAVTLGIKPGTARVRLHRARQALADDPEFAELLNGRGLNALAVNGVDAGQ